MPERPVTRVDGKVEYDGKVYAVAEGAALFGMPGWHLSLSVLQLSIRRELNVFGADANGDIRPTGTASIRCITRIIGYRRTLGVLGAPQTASNQVTVTLYPMKEDDPAAGDDWSRRSRLSWPLNAIWRHDPLGGVPNIDVVAHVPPDLFDVIARTAGDGRLADLVIGIRLERAFISDRDRSNGPEDEPAWLAPFDDHGRQPGPNLGYVSSFWIKESDVYLRVGDEVDDEDAGVAVPPSAPAQVAVTAAAPDLSPIVRQLSSRLGLLIGLVAVLIVAVLLRS